jgi:hypothetical protein
VESPDIQIIVETVPFYYPLYVSDIENIVVDPSFETDSLKPLPEFLYGEYTDDILFELATTDISLLTFMVAEENTLLFDMKSLIAGEYEVSMKITNTSSVPVTDFTYEFNVTILEPVLTIVEEVEEVIESTVAIS